MAWSKENNIEKYHGLVLYVCLIVDSKSKSASLYAYLLVFFDFLDF